MDKNPKTAKTNWVPVVGKPYSFRRNSVRHLVLLIIK